jgi:hypothetical protein
MAGQREREVAWEERGSTGERNRKAEKVTDDVAMVLNGEGGGGEGGDGERKWFLYFFFCMRERGVRTWERVTEGMRESPRGLCRGPVSNNCHLIKMREHATNCFATTRNHKTMVSSQNQPIVCISNTCVNKQLNQDGRRGLENGRMCIHEL